MPTSALSNRYDGLQSLRQEPRLLVARAHMRGQPVLLWHREGLVGEPAAASRLVADRLLALQGQSSLLDWHTGPSGVTWVVPEDGAQFLDDWLDAAGTVPLATALHLLHEIARALEGLHRERVLHLHLRPATVRVRPGERPQALLLPAEAVPFESAAAVRHELAVDDARFTAPELTGRTAGRPGPRTDLYLLGLLAYRLLAGRFPFHAIDPLGWLHAHLAVPAPDLRSVRPDTPAALAELVAALLAKSPEQRPASTRAVAEDLQRCIDALAQAQPLRPQALRAPRARLALPRLLLGREAEHAALQQALARVQQAGRVELAVLSGPAGIGKSSLAARFMQEARALGALAIGAKCEQLGSQRPYPALADLLEDLARQLPDMPPLALGPQGGALAALSPGIAPLLGAAGAELVLAPEHARQRLLSGLVALLARLSRERPLVLLVDDAHWSDWATLWLIGSALADRALQRILLVVVVRDTAPDSAPASAVLGPSGPLHTLGPLARTDIRLAGLHDAEVLQWMQAALPGGLAHPGPTLARLVQRSAGNPLFLGQLLDTMVARGQLLPGSDGRWLLDESTGGWDALPASALEAGAARLRALQAEDAALLGMAAAHGRLFDAALLARASGRPAHEVAAALAHAQAEGLVEPTRDGPWRFLHDRLQQVAYEAGDTAMRQGWHLALGQVLQAEEGDAPLFETCRHLQQALPLLDAAQRRAFVLAAQRAAARARAGAAFAQQAALMRAALAALPAELPLDPPAQLALWHDAAEALLMARDFDAADRCLIAAAPLAADALSRARGDELRIGWLIAQERGQEALDAGVAALARLGLRTDPARATLQTLVQLARLKLTLRTRTMDQWLAATAPVTTDGRHLQLDRLIFATINVAHTLASPLYAVLGLAGAHQALQRGLTPWSWQPIAVAGHVLSGVFDDIDTGHALGELSVRLSERVGSHSLSFNHLFYVMHWKVPVASTLPQLRNCFEQAERSGNFEIAGYAVCMLVGVTWNAMGSLTALDEALHEARGFAARRNIALVSDCCDTFEQLLRLLRGPVPQGTIAPLRRQRAGVQHLPHDELFDLIHGQLAVMLNVMAGHPADEVVAHGLRVRRNLHRMAGNFSTPLHHWFEALLHTDRLRERASAASRRLVQRHLRKLRAWSAHCPANHAHRVASLEGELAALAGRSAEAAGHFAQAVQLARTHGFTGDAAILAHRWARHCARRGDPAGMRAALEQAHALYSRWGATSMVRQIEDSLPAFARPRHDPPLALPLDTATLVKASQAIGAELAMDAVAERLLQQVMENAGARYSALLLPREGRLLLVAQRADAGARLEDMAPRPLEETGLPHALLRAVAQGRDAVVLQDACGPHAWGLAARWGALGGQAAVSVLCVPVVAAGGVLGALYLENELAADCFTPERATLARLLAGQAAISLSNAQLYAQLSTAHEELRSAHWRLEERVAERTRALEHNHAQLRHLERQLAADEERQRIMRDLHDGLGSQLFVTLSRVEGEDITRGEISEALRACIADMRLVLEAMGPDGNDFLAAWGSFRFRWEAQLRTAGLASQWPLEVPGEVLELPPATGLQVLRIAQEALTNVLKHARGARQAHIALTAASQGLCVEVRDDGIGPQAAAGPAGRGLANMRARAQRLNGHLRVEPAQPGMRVLLELPLG